MQSLQIDWYINYNKKMDIKSFTEQQINKYQDILPQRISFFTK